MTATEMLLELRHGETSGHRRVGLGVEGGSMMQRGGLKVCRVRVLIYCRRSL